jgi:hypothetical protein
VDRECELLGEHVMTLDRQLIDSIKEHFVRKSAAQLQQILQAHDLVRWSEEAFAAAREVLDERATGRAPEPLVAEEEPPDSPRTDPYSLGLFFGLLGAGAGPIVLGAAMRHLVDRKFTASSEDLPDPDLPVPFGFKIAWLALNTRDAASVATALELQGTRQATWKEGIDAAYKSLVFVTPPLGDWTLAVSTALFPRDRVEPFVKPLLERLSRQFGDAQYFCTHRVPELHVWARARKGRLVRGYGWLGEKGHTLWDDGSRTLEERDLGLRFFDERSPEAENSGSEVSMLPDEASVMQLAALWSIDPSSLDENFKELVMGMLGSITGSQNPSNR